MILGSRVVHFESLQEGFSLTQRAKAVETSSRLPSSDQYVELALALVCGDVTTKQAAHVLGYNVGKGANSVVYWAFVTLRRAIADGRVKIERVGSVAGDDTKQEGRVHANS